MSQFNTATTVASLGVIDTITTGDANVVVPDGAGNVNFTGSHGIVTTGAVANSFNAAIDNTITLGDLSVIAAGSPALTLTTGNLEFLGSNQAAATNQMIRFTTNTGLDGNISMFKNMVFIGQQAGNTTMTGLFNVGIGSLTSYNLTTGAQNIAIGNGTLEDTTTGTNNIAIGYVAGGNITTGSQNIAIGSSTFANGAAGLLTGSNNIAIGNEAGRSYTGAESNNILFGAATTGTIGESNVMRLGTTGAGAGQVSTAFIAGTYGVTPAGATHRPVIMDSVGQVGTQAQLAVAQGGTGAATLTDHGVMLGSGTAAVSVTAVGATGEVLTGVTGGDPVWAAPAASSISITGDSGGALVGVAFTFTGDTTGLTFAGGGSTETLGGTLVVANGGTGAVTLTDHGVLVGSGTSAIDALAVGSTGTLLVGVTGADPAFGTSATGDFTFTSATAAQDRALTVSNTDATGASYSAAHLELITQSASTGDPYVRFNVNGGQDYAIGIDNSASDALLIKDDTNPSTGNTLWSMTSAGERTMPLQPAFAAYLATSDLNVTGNGTNYQMGQGNALTENFDQGGDFNTNGTFTAPVTGKYALLTGYLVQQCTTATNSDLNITTSNGAWRSMQQNPATVSVAGSFGFGMSIFADMDSGDTAVSNMNMSGIGADTADVFGSGGDRRTWFSGYLVC